MSLRELIISLMEGEMNEEIPIKVVFSDDYEYLTIDEVSLNSYRQEMVLNLKEFCLVRADYYEGMKRELEDLYEKVEELEK